jgi:hypothetical protein
MTLDSL